MTTAFIVPFSSSCGAAPGKTGGAGSSRVASDGGTGGHVRSGSSGRVVTRMLCGNKDVHRSSRHSGGNDHHQLYHWHSAGRKQSHRALCAHATLCGKVSPCARRGSKRDLSEASAKRGASVTEPHRHEGQAAGEARLVLNPITGEYLAQSPGRMQRREGAPDCPFCADLESGRVAPDTQAWIRPNDFPALSPPAGECYVLIYSADHDRSFADLERPAVERVLGLWQQAYSELSPRYPCVMTWETSGEAIGQTQTHPHGQTYGLAVVPPTLAREFATVEAAQAAGRGCPFCTLVRQELGGPRVVASRPYWLAVVPPFARYPYEIHLYARRHISAVNALALGNEETAELATFLPRIVRAYSRVFEAPMPYMLAVHQLADPRFHLHLELLPVGRAPGKLKLAASTEMAWGFWLNDSIPEEKARELRDAYAAS